MPAFTIVSTSLSQGSDTAEVDNREGDFRSADEAIGYARRVAEELFELAGELALEFDYSQVAIYDGEVEPAEFDVADPALTGVWLFFEDGIAWSSAEDLRKEDGGEAAN